MAFINVSETGNYATVQLSLASNMANAVTVPGMTELTVTNATGSYRWKQLDTAGELAITTVSTNSLSMNVVLDPTTFFGTGGNTTATEMGLFRISNEKKQTYFRVYFDGVDTGSKYLEGTGYVSSLAPTVNPDAPVWQSPMTIEVSGDYTVGTV